MTEPEHYQQLVQLLLPEGLLNYFDITNTIFYSEALNVHLEEKNLPPQECKLDKLESKGFHPPVMAQDFPIRDKGIFLHVKRRR